MPGHKIGESENIVEMVSNSNIPPCQHNAMLAKFVRFGNQGSVRHLRAVCHSIILVQLTTIARVADAVPIVVDNSRILEQEPEHIYLATSQLRQTSPIDRQRNTSMSSRLKTFFAHSLP